MGCAYVMDERVVCHIRHLADWALEACLALMSGNEVCCLLTQAACGIDRVGGGFYTGKKKMLQW